MTAPEVPLWMTDTPSFMPAELVEQMTYAEWEEKYKKGEAPGQNAVVDDVGFTDEQALAFLRGETNGLTADATEHTGAMIALVPDAATAQRLVIPGGEPLGELHLTLCYLGEAAKIVPMQRSQLLEAMRRIADVTPIVDAEAFGVATWNPHDDEKETSLIYNVSGGELEDVFEDVLGPVSRILEDGLPEQYDPWSPHVCAAYSNDTGLLNAMSQKLGHVRFDRLRVAFAGVVTDIPLYDGSDLTSPGDSEMDDAYEGEHLNAAGQRESDVNTPGGSHNLRNYWVRGAGAAKIRWGTDGSFSRCVRNLGKYVKNPQGLCAEYHKAATGEWPAEKGVESATTIGVTLDTQPRLLSTYPSLDAVIADATAVTEPEVELDGSWEGVLAVEDIETGDQRKFAPGSITWVHPKHVVAPLQWARENLGEHKGSVTVGRINEIWRDQVDPRVIRGRGMFNLNDEDGARAFQQVKDGFLRGISIDPDQVSDADVELVFPESFDDGGPVTLSKPELTIYHAGRIRGATLVAFPAFIEGAIRLTSKTNQEAAVTASVSTRPWRAVQHEIALGDEMTGLVASAAFAFVRDLDDVVDRQQCRFLHHEIDTDTGEVGPANLVACAQHIDGINSGRTFGLGYDELFSAYQHLAEHITDAGQTPVAFALVNDAVVASIPSEPPLEWFVDPRLSGPTPVTVGDDGRVFGHAAVWGTCHTGFADRCVTPPREPDYSFFTTGEVMTAGGQRVAVGQITLGTSHAATTGLSVAKAVDHYGDTGTAVADVSAGVDAHGIWVAGAVRPTASSEHLHALRASALSGDWRRIGGSLRMVALLAVNVPGFPIPRVTTALQDDRQMSLVAAGILDREHIPELNVDFNAEVLKLAGSCGIPLGDTLKKKKKMNYASMGLEELVALVNGA